MATTYKKPDAPAEPVQDDKPQENRPQDDRQKDGGPKKDDHKGRIWRLAAIIAVIFGIIFLIAVLPRLGRNKQVKADAKSQTQADATPTVNTVPVQQPPAFDDLTLPGNIQAVQQTAIVARASGYVKRYYADIGDRVKAGQLLATIATPDLDQQVTQARAQVSQAQAAVTQAQANLNQQQANVAQGTANLSRAQAQYEQSRTDLARARAALAQAQEAAAQQNAQLAQAQANLNLARVTAQRYRNLLAEGAIDQQTTDQAVASEQTNTANVSALASALRASEANVSAYRDAVGSSLANVSAYLAGIQAGRAAVGAAQANAPLRQRGHHRRPGQCPLGPGECRPPHIFTGLRGRPRAPSQASSPPATWRTGRSSGPPAAPAATAPASAAARRGRHPRAALPAAAHRAAARPRAAGGGTPACSPSPNSAPCVSI